MSGPQQLSREDERNLSVRASRLAGRRDHSNDRPRHRPAAAVLGEQIVGRPVRACSANRPPPNPLAEDEELSPDEQRAYRARQP